MQREKARGILLEPGRGAVLETESLLSRGLGKAAVGALGALSTAP